MTEESSENLTTENELANHAKEHDSDWIRVDDMRKCLNAEHFEKDEIYDYAVMLLEWAISKRAMPPREAIISLMAEHVSTIDERRGLFHRIARFFTDWSGVDENGETISINASDMRTICSLRQDAYYCRKRYDELIASMRPAILCEEDLSREKYPVVWLEDIDKDEVIPALAIDNVPGRCGYITTKGLTYPLTIGYNKRWRAWTDEPTSELRKAAKWKMEL